MPEYKYTFEDKRGVHRHTMYSGAYDPKRPITCPLCLDLLEQQRVELCAKYGWKEWPFPKEV